MPFVGPRLHDLMSPMSNRGSLLIVDDEEANLQKLRRTFINDFEVHEATSGEQATEMLSQQVFDAIITDQRMPGISGVELLRRSLEMSPQSVRIILTGYTEIEDLMDAINKGQVDRYVTKPWEPFSLRQGVIQDLELRELKRERQLWSEQLRIAKEVQSMLFPQVLPEIENLEYTGFCRPAREVGGDYYDFLQLEPEKLWVAVGDISGKGMSAALLMANLQGLLRSQAVRHGEAIDGLVAEVNRFLHQTTAETKFATLFCGLLDTPSRRLHYVNAGHCCPLLARSVNGELAITPLEATGTIVGMFSDTPFRQETVELEAGDLLVVFTDGATEAFDRSRAPLGDQRLAELIRRHAHLHLEKFCETVYQEITDYSEGVQHDDITIVALRVAG